MSETFKIDGAGKATIIKDPAENLDYIFDWSKYLTPISDTIASVAFAVTGATLGMTSHTTTTATAWVSGGTVDETAVLKCTVTLATGRVAERSIFLKIKDR